MKLAAVLVLLYEHAGHLRVLLTTRSQSLRTHAGQTALPGGKVDDTDKDVFETAFREANEEVGLPLNCPDIYTLCTLEPFVSLHKLVVTPVVAFLANPTILDDLKAAEDEVAHIFNHRLDALLDPSIMRGEPIAEKSSENWIYHEEFYQFSDHIVPTHANNMYRNNRFRSCASPVKGLTADMLITTAEIAFAKPPTFERYAPGQIYAFDLIRKALWEQDAA
ncbi:NUDIX hydrolase domain-like protein [Mycena floridula]|nr:NUDIX hydrolase domain-like protein [Mycena floridula]